MDIDMFHPTLDSPVDRKDYSNMVAAAAAVVVAVAVDIHCICLSEGLFHTSEHRVVVREDFVALERCLAVVTVLLDHYMLDTVEHRFAHYYRQLHHET